MKKYFGSKPVFVVNNPKWGKIVFTERDKRIHLDKHPELEDRDFLDQAMQLCKNETKFYRSLTHPFDCVVLYKYVGQVENPLNERYNLNYIKVILGLRSKVKRVLSAYLVTHIKEKGKQPRVIRK